MNSSEIKNINNNNGNNNKSVGNINLINIKEDILFFKNDILKDLKKLDNKLNIKFEGQFSLLTEKLDKYDLKMEAITEKIASLGNQISTNFSLKEKVEELYEFKNKIKDNILNLDIKIEGLMRNLNNTINRYDNILLESVLYSEIIGPIAKFKNFHELIDFILLNLNQLNSYKEKNILDIKNFKKKLETLSQSLKVHTESINRDYINKLIRGIEKKMNNYIEEFNSKLVQINMENNEYGKNLNDNNNKNIEKLKLEIEENIKCEINKIGDISEKFDLKFNNYQKEFNSIKKRFILLSEFIKNNRFQTNESKNIANKLKFNKKANFLIGKENPEKFNQEIKDIKDYEESKASLNEKYNKIENSDIPSLKEYINENVDLKEHYKERKELINQKKENIKSLDNRILSNDLNSKIEVEDDDDGAKLLRNSKLKEMINPKREEESEKSQNIKNNKSIKYNDKYENSNLNSKKFTLNYNEQNKDENMKENNLKNEILNNEKNINDFNEQNKANINYSKSNEIEEGNKNKKKEIIKFVKATNKREINNSKNKYEYKRNIIENSINQYSYSFGFDENNNSIIKKYSEFNNNNFGNEIISIINYGNSRKIPPINSKEKKDDLIKNKKDIFIDETNNNKKLFELKNSIINLNKKTKNGCGDSEILSNTISISNRKILEGKLYFSKSNNHFNLDKIKNLKKNHFNSNNNISNNLNNSLIYKRIDIKSNKNSFELESKKLTPIRIKGNNKTNNLIEKRINEIEMCKDEDKKIKKLVEKIKDIIPYDENFTLSDRINNRKKK